MGFNCCNLTKVYRTGNGSTPAIADVSFHAGEQEFVCIVGPSGCGKTTLLKLIARLIEPTSGRIDYSRGTEGGPLQAALVFQDHALFPWMTMEENIAFGLETQGVGRRERGERARAFIEKFGLGGFASSFPAELSTGMRQRAGIARALLVRPRILLMDEPFGSLDAQTRLVLQEELLRLWKETTTTVVYVTHDIEEALLLGDRVLVMTGRPGRIMQDITVPLGRPRDPASIDSPEVVEIKWSIWKMLEKEVRRSLAIRV